MADGYSNQEIADQLFVSLNTIKTHISRLFEKMEVKRRTQAVELAKKLSLIP
jgi:NarL family two-component system response regulator LiaR